MTGPRGATRFRPWSGHAYLFLSYRHYDRAGWADGRRARLQRGMNSVEDGCRSGEVASSAIGGSSFALAGTSSSTAEATPAHGRQRAAAARLPIRHEGRMWDRRPVGRVAVGPLGLPQFPTTTRLPGPSAYHRRIPARIRMSNPTGPTTSSNTIAIRMINTAAPKLILWTLMMESTLQRRMMLRLIRIERLLIDITWDRLSR